MDERLQIIKDLAILGIEESEKKSVDDYFTGLYRSILYQVEQARKENLDTTPDLC